MAGEIQSSLLGLPGLGTGAASDSGNANQSNGVDGLAQEDFLRLMTAQLSAQDPFEPMDSSQFLSQFAQFGTVSGIQDLQTSFEGLSTSLQSYQALQASTLVGRAVLVEGNRVALPATGTVNGSVSTGGASNIVLNVHDGAGALVYHQSLTPDATGKTTFQWDGSTNAGGQAPAGVYIVAAQGTTNGEPIALSTQVVAAVDSVTVGSGGLGLTLNLAGVGSVPFGDVLEIR